VIPSSLLAHLGHPVYLTQILQRVAALTPESRARWGKMNVHQMMCHLADSFEVGLGHRPASTAVSFLQRTIVKWGALYLPARWPQGVPTRPEVEQGAGGTPPAEFESDRARLVRRVEEFAKPGRDLDGLMHPTFGPLTEAEWMRWGYLHADHHLRQFGA